MQTTRASGALGRGPASSRLQRTVVLVGGGHAHVQVLRGFAMDPPANVRLVLVVDRPIAVYSGMVPGFVAGDYATAELEIDVVPLARRAGAAVLLAEALDLDPIAREITLAGRPPIRFDLASLDVGSTVRALERPGVAELTLSTRPIGRFVAAVEDRLAALTRPDAGAAGSADPGDASPPRILVVGGGAAGCELAFTLDARLRRAGRCASIGLVTSEATLLAGGSPALRRRIEREARSRGIAVRTETRIARVEGTHVRPQLVTQADERLEADLVVWATGAAPVAFPCGRTPTALPRSADGFLAIRETLQCVGHDHVFAVGDCARMVDHPWVPRAGVYAVRQGPMLEHNLRAALGGRSLRRYRPQRDFLALLNLGDGRALGGKWGMAVAGRAVFRLKDRVDRAFVARFRADERAGGAPAPTATTEAMPCGGCAAKLGAAPLEAALARLPEAPDDASVVAGVAARDDVAVTRGADGTLQLHNIDAIRAFCDDPWLVGRVAAVNAVSDLYAKGGCPRHAQALIGLPPSDPAAAADALHQALTGIRQALDPLGVSLIGGHTLAADVLSVGLAVSGDGPDEASLRLQSGARPGDELWLTKPLGTGVVLAADMRGLARGPWLEAALASMLRPNATAGRLASALPVHAATDVTGFGLAGHLLTLLRAPGLGARLERDAIECLPGARALFERGLRSTAHPANRSAFAARVAGANELDEAWLFDPQTSGGLLLAVPQHAGRALVDAFALAGEPAPARIGRITALAPEADRPGSPSVVIEIVPGGGSRS